MQDIDNSIFNLVVEEISKEDSILKHSEYVKTYYPNVFVKILNIISYAETQPKEIIPGYLFSILIGLFLAFETHYDLSITHAILETKRKMIELSNN